MDESLQRKELTHERQKKLPKNGLLSLSKCETRKLTCDRAKVE